MVLITSNQTIYIHEAAREKLAEVWQKNYEANMTKLIPIMAEDLANNELFVNGAKIPIG